MGWWIFATVFQVFHFQSGKKSNFGNALISWPKDIYIIEFEIKNIVFCIMFLIYY